MPGTESHRLADYLLGPEGQAVPEKFEYGSPAKNLGFKRWRPHHRISTEKYEKDLERWEKLLKEAKADKFLRQKGRVSLKIRHEIFGTAKVKT